MEHLHRRSNSNPATTSAFPLLETPSVRSSIPTTPQPMHTFGQHQLSVQQPPTPPQAVPGPATTATTNATGNTAQKPAHANTFVHKLYNMVVDNQYQHLIAWNYTGSSFIVCNIMEFSRDVLPKHFKHNNFSSFVRQLNMYGFHKVNKSPRGHRTLAENQIWEFSHAKFLRNRPDLLDDIKRKAMESSDTARRETGDLHAHLAMMQVAQSDMMQQIGHLFENFNELVKELAETRRKQASQQQMMKNMAQYISQQNGGQLPSGFNIDQFIDGSKQERPPSIFITSPETNNNNTNDVLHDVFGGVSRSPLSVQTQNLHHHHHQHARPDLAPPSSNRFGTHLPPSPSPTSLISDDESSSLYSPHSPHSPHPPTHHSSSLDPPTPQPQASSHDQHQASFTFVNSLDPLSHR
ncbi:hypothetical protein O0I10_000645 [Lichtheimia ornata]|uniref:HSF-type DNA-binding domain-containing protein n=1 Tax=Lichtheimia ornata TaxID=688661 RepID=A0AAD8DIK7_9FUNG|nr:uncharacterized protein O0I10_000645 [Lichtheimia ornata]KAJ8663406.1 hypothetical protein O0I10_000645 [Lichtheimia ornata]